VFGLVSDDTGKQMRFRINIFLMKYRTQIQIGFQAAESTFNLTYNLYISRITSSDRLSEEHLTK
jgi:hypothetical protein